MQKAQVFLREDQKVQLRSIARFTGRKQSELIRRGVDLAIEEAQKGEGSWQKGWSQACGIWRDRDDIDVIIKEYRADMDTRIDQLQK